MRLEAIKEEELSQLINRHELIEPLPINLYGSIPEKLFAGTYELLPEINFGEPHPLEVVTPSWWSYPSISINTVVGFTKFYHENYGINEVWEPCSDSDEDTIKEPIETQWATRYPDEPNIPRAWRK